MIIPFALFDKYNISYIKGSFGVFKPSYLYKNGKINSWKIRGHKYHLGKGYSDHLPIYATYKTNKLFLPHKQQTKPNQSYDIGGLYKQKYINHYKIKDAVVIYKFKNNAIIKQKDNRAVYLYNCAKNLKYGFRYDLDVSKIDNFYGLKEIKQIDRYKSLGKYKDINLLFLDINTKDILNIRYQNEVIKNLKGYYNKGYLYWKDKHIKIYTKDKKLLPSDGKDINIHYARIGIFYGKIQIILDKLDNYEYIK
jgi:hypothetical protein